jgi:hypothetical protein
VIGESATKNLSRLSVCFEKFPQLSPGFETKTFFFFINSYNNNIYIYNI